MKYDSSNKQTCTECNAVLVDGLSCWETLGLLLGWEEDNEELQKVHFLTVATYNIQHPSMFQDGISSELLQLHHKYINNEITISEIRMIIGKMARGEIRVLKPINERKIIPKKWQMTIADVYIPNKRERAAERARTWAKSIHSEDSR